MKLRIRHQDLYSRGELLLRTIFGFFYIIAPHSLLLMFVGLWSAILTFISFWIVLFTGKYPESYFEYQLKVKRWMLRLQAIIMNLVDGYPSFGINGSSDKIDLDVPYPSRLSRGLALVKLFFAPVYVGIPHGFCLFFRMVATQFLQFLAWWVVLFTGKYPESWHEFNVGTLRWMQRVGLYSSYMTDEYPPFSGKELQTVPVGEETK
ncbi:MAG: DUF4389 domain-containing protein [Chitinivibrionales bacterium]|nr:DUF4389 domain-containing protein [Chitinivibrionales bacterium]